MADLAKIRAREYDPAMERHAEATTEKIGSRIDVNRVNLFGSMARRVAGNANKVGLLRQMAGELTTAAKGLVPCSSGCSHCCHMPTLITVEEAAVIAQETGTVMATPTRYFEGRDDTTWLGVPCTFLGAGGRCTIYESRPFACRMHISIDRDSLLCEIVPGEEIRTPRIDLLIFDCHYVSAFGELEDVKLADIREFFPARSTTD